MSPGLKGVGRWSGGGVMKAYRPSDCGDRHDGVESTEVAPLATGAVICGKEKCR